ncbi:MAG: hypothetical protein NC043_02510 [Muribaculaceae bacterium]|nr:hypothetical protein [Muribaculaceae bacterium]
MRICIILLLLISAVIPSRAVRLKGYKSTSGGGNITILVDSIDFRKDLTRAYVRFKGRPHTSSRIDALTVTVPANAASVSMTDIDGVDAKRWFQWEDDGMIDIEVDFPAMKPSDKVIFTAETPYGKTQCTAVRTAVNSKKTTRTTKHRK